MRAMAVLAAMCACSGGEVRIEQDAFYGPPCRAVTLDGGIEYGCVMDNGSAGVCGPGPMPTLPACHVVCSEAPACVQVHIVDNQGAAYCYCR